MSDINKPYSFYTLFKESFLVSRGELGQRPDRSLSDDARERFLSEEVKARVTEVIVPKIQRDYAQGRSNESEVRENFLQALYDAIVDETGKKRCSLNFIYGHFLESRDRAGAVSFVPYDGQQRLTTLYLLHWYASRKDKVEEGFLRGFRYDTRFSSTTFTAMFLADIKGLDISESEAKWFSEQGVREAIAGHIVPVGTIRERGTFSKWLMNKNGFARSWVDDPTVNGMLVMLDDIHSKFHDVPNLWKRLCEEDVARLPIYFYFQKVSRTLDAGSIFIKMNSRGKLLTEFECFKADFLRLLRKGEFPEKMRIELSEKIDKTWEQAFWEIAKRQELKETDTDVLLMRYVNFVIDLIGFERGVFSRRNAQLHRYNPKNLKDIVLLPDGKLNESVIQDLTFAVDTWCGDKNEDRADEYFQSVFGSDKIKLFFKPEPCEFFQTIILGKELTLNAVAMFYAVLVARKKGLTPRDLELRLRSARNLVYFMDKGITELPYILQKVRLLMEEGLSVDFKNENSQRKFTDTQIREEQFKEWISAKDVGWYAEIRKLEEVEWFKGQIGSLLSEALEATDEADRMQFINGVFAKRVALFKKLFCTGKISDSLLRKALFYTTDNGSRYWVSSKGWFWMGASVDDFSWLAARPYFTREGGPQNALKGLLDHAYFTTATGIGQELLSAFVNRKRQSLNTERRTFDVLYYLDRYYDEFFDRWSGNEKKGHSKCVGRILPECDGLVMQMLDGKTRSSPYWDPYLYVALRHVDPDSLESNGSGAFKDLFKQYEAWNGCRIVHRNSGAKIWNGAYGVQIKTSAEFVHAIETDLDGLTFELVHGQESVDDAEKVWLLRTRDPGDQTFRDRVDRIAYCEKLLRSLKEKQLDGVIPTLQNLDHET